MMKFPQNNGLVWKWSKKDSPWPWSCWRSSGVPLLVDSRLLLGRTRALNRYLPPDRFQKVCTKHKGPRKFSGVSCSFLSFGGNEISWFKPTPSTIVTIEYSIVYYSYIYSIYSINHGTDYPISCGKFKKCLKPPTSIVNPIVIYSIYNNHKPIEFPKWSASTRPPHRAPHPVPGARCFGGTSLMRRRNPAPFTKEPAPWMDIWSSPTCATRWHYGWYGYITIICMVIM